MKDTEVVAATYVGEENENTKPFGGRLVMGVTFPKGKRVAVVGDQLIKKLRALELHGEFKLDAPKKDEGEPQRQKLAVPRTRSRAQMVAEMKRKGRRAPTLAIQPRSIDGAEDAPA